MSDTPKLMKAHELCSAYAQEMSLSDVAAWLQQQGVGEVRRPFFARFSHKGSPWRIDVGKPGRYLVVPLDPKEGM